MNGGARHGVLRWLKNTDKYVERKRTLFFY